MSSTTTADNLHQSGAKTSIRPHMGLKRSLRAFFQNYARLQGRASRSEFWWAELVVVVVTLVFSAATRVLQAGSANLDALTTSLSVVAGAWGIITFIPALALGARRLHDTDHSAWWLLLILVPVVGTIVLIIMWCGASNPAGADFDGETQPKLGL